MKAMSLAGRVSGVRQAPRQVARATPAASRQQGSQAATMDCSSHCNCAGSGHCK